ncbi:MAG: SpoIID/LytB domain-containing protein [Terracidiphilus sp.]|jgi:stage II sporulation protein D
MKPAPLAFSLVFFCAAAFCQAAPRSTIRVGIWTLWRDKEVAVTPVSGASIRVCKTCGDRPLTAMSIRVKNAAMSWTDLEGHAHSSAELLLTGKYQIAAHGEALTISYPVKIAAQSGSLVLVATLSVERYVELAVAAESGAADSPESRKALAVVARSFALAPTHGHAAFDVCDSTHCQWVHWRTTPEAHAATLATAGESLWRNGRRMEAYFHQNCGGRTAAAEEVWPARVVADRAAKSALVSRVDPYCSRTGSSEWSASLSRTELTQALAAAGLAAPGWKSLTVTRRGESGRATVLLVGATKVQAEDLRLAVGRALGWNRVRSNWFEIAAEGDGFLFHGRGSGHGVGLCQTGAAEMAREGHSYHEIIAQYFPSAVLAEETTGATWQMLNGQGFTLETSEASDSVYLPALAHALTEAESRSGLAPGMGIAVRAYRSTPAFRDATLAPGWVAAFTEGDQIALQPLRILAARKLLDAVLLHEFLHALVEEQCTAHTPLWLREGLVEAWSDDSSKKPGAPSFCHPERPRATRGGVEGSAFCNPGERVGNKITPESIDDQLAHSATEAESEAAHRAAGWCAQQLLDRFGRAQVLEWLRAGVPQSALIALR